MQHHHHHQHQHHHQPQPQPQPQQPIINNGSGKRVLSHPDPSNNGRLVDAGAPPKTLRSSSPPTASAGTAVPETPPVWTCHHPRGVGIQINRPTASFFFSPTSPIVLYTFICPACCIYLSPLISVLSSLRVLPDLGGNGDISSVGHRPDEGGERSLGLLQHICAGPRAAVSPRHMCAVQTDRQCSVPRAMCAVATTMNASRAACAACGDSCVV